MNTMDHNKMELYSNLSEIPTRYLMDIRDGADIDIVLYEEVSKKEFDISFSCNDICFLAIRVRVDLRLESLAGGGSITRTDDGTAIHGDHDMKMHMIASIVKMAIGEIMAREPERLPAVSHPAAVPTLPSISRSTIGTIRQVIGLTMASMNAAETTNSDSEKLL